jgi:hypothetical protein
MGRQPNGSTLVIVKIDTKNGSILAALTQNRCWPTATASAITPNGSTHILLRLLENQLVRTRIGLIKGVDLIAEGGLLVIEPSSLDGRQYVWLQDPAWGIAQVRRPGCWMTYGGQDWWLEAGQALNASSRGVGGRESAGPAREGAVGCAPGPDRDPVSDHPSRGRLKSHGIIPTRNSPVF